jgi:hypothetical protein
MGGSPVKSGRSMHSCFTPAIVLVTLVLLIPPASARSYRMRQIPHGRAISCTACHVDPDGGGARNQFGLDVDKLVTPGGRELFWTPELASLDSDGDGLTNGEELQDPGGTWKQGQPDPGSKEQLSNPGIPDLNDPVEHDGTGPGGVDETEHTPVDRTTFDYHAPAVYFDFDSRVRHDHNPDDRDLDGQSYTSILVTNLFKQRLDMKFSGWGNMDLDSDDAYDDALEGKQLRFSEAWFDLHDFGPLSQLRIGRQYFYDVDNLHFDGARWTFMRKKPIEAFVFGGRPVSYYNSAEDDWLGGGGIVFEPGWRSRHQIDAYHLEEGDEGFLLSAWRWNQAWGRSWHTYTTLRGIDDEVRDLRTHASTYIEKLKLGLNAGYYYQPHRRAEGNKLRTRQLSSLGNVLGLRQPFHQFNLNINKYIGDQTASFKGKPWLHCANCHLPMDDGNRCAVCHQGNPHRNVIAKPPPPQLVAAGRIDPAGACLPCHPVARVPITHPYNTITPFQCVQCHIPR